MRKLLPYRLIVFTALQLAALFFLAWVVLNLLPVMVKTLFAGMNQWNFVSIAFCWAIQVGLVAVLLSVRDFLQPIVLHWMAKAPFLSLKISWVLLALASLWNYGLLISLLYNTAGRVGFFIMGQWLLLLLLLYFLTAIVAPMGSLTVYRLLFRRRKGEKFYKQQGGKSGGLGADKWLIHDKASAASDFWTSHTKLAVAPVAKPRGFPKWVFVVLWFLFFLLLDWTGCG